MLIEDIFMELRARLRSCNVFIKTNVDLNKKCNLKINIQSNCIVMNYCSNEYDSAKRCDSLSSIESLSESSSEDDSDITATIAVGKFCQIIPNSMSGLKIENRNISFRILTETKNGGTFYQEVLPTSSAADRPLANGLRIKLRTNEDVKFCCKNCSNIISNNSIQFKRILELPTDNLDMSEWFCHNHGGHSANNTVLEPSNQDFLYRLTFFLLNSSVLSAKTNKFNAKRDTYHCERCLEWLGLKTKDSIKLFNSTVKINQKGAETALFEHKIPASNVLEVNDFIFTIELMAKEFNLGYQFAVMCRLVLECSASGSQKKYLMLWIMDRELQVLHSDGIMEDNIELRSSVVTKILFKIEDCMNDEVESWMSDPAVVSTEISKIMFLKGVDHLNRMSLKVPESFRNTNGFTVTYLIV